MYVTWVEKIIMLVMIYFISTDIACHEIIFYVVGFNLHKSEAQRTKLNFNQLLNLKLKCSDMLRNLAICLQFCW